MGGWSHRSLYCAVGAGGTETGKWSKVNIDTRRSVIMARSRQHAGCVAAELRDVHVVQRDTILLSVGAADCGLLDAVCPSDCSRSPIL